MNTQLSKQEATLLAYNNLPLLVRKNFRDKEGNPFELAPSQVEIVDCIANKRYDKIEICCTTQYGKTESVAIGAILLGYFNSGEEIISTAPTWQQTRTLFSAVERHIYNNRDFRKELDTSEEISAQKISFKNGTTIRILSAGGSSEGESLLSFGCTTLLNDECGSLSSVVYRNKLLRMLGARRGDRRKLLVNIGTPHRRNHFYEAWNDPAFHKIHIGWEKGVAEGRLDYDFVMYQKRIMSPIEFQMWYCAEFPEESTDAIFKLSDINAQKYPVPEEFFKDWNLFKSLQMGIDVARFGNDFTILTATGKTVDGHKCLLEQQKYTKQDTTQTVGRAVLMHDKYLAFGRAFDWIIPDDSGVGGGVTDGLMEHYKNGRIKSRVHGFIAGASAEEPTRYANLKSEAVMRLSMDSENKMLVLGINPAKELIDQLQAWQKEITSKGQIRIVDPAEKSPDFADSFYLSCYEPPKSKKIYWGIA